MNKILEVVGSLVTAAVVATGSALEKGCEIADSAACNAGKIITNISEGITNIVEDKSKNDSLGS